MRGSRDFQYPQVALDLRKVEEPEIYLLCRHFAQIETVKELLKRAAKGQQSTFA